jgi:glucose-6-phosphate isomerase
MNALPTLSPADTKSWSQLLHHAESWRTVHLSQLFETDVARSVQFAAEAPGLRYDYALQRVGPITLRLLSNLAAERGLPAWREALLSGQPVNDTENRAAWHTALRAGSSAPSEVKETLSQIKKLTGKIRSEKTFKRIVNLGTGGSDLGPRLVVDALAKGGSEARELDVRFAANVDPKDLERALEGADPATTLFIVVSKTFTTQETMSNAEAAKKWLGSRDTSKHFIAISANRDLARTFGTFETLPMWDWVGGRFSVWSAAGFAAALAIGFERFEELLAGGQDIDLHFSTASPEKNVPLLMALIGVWNTNFLGAATHAVLPYSNALRLLPAYLQQLEMESNGKRVDRQGLELHYASAPVVWGAEGTASQHSFHQLLHQGTQMIPVDFIDICSNEVLSANRKAQAEALAFGTTDPSLPPYKQYPGNRPSSTLELEKLDARNLGRLIALYEHKVFAQGVIWNINSFDQWGVELGKQLASKLLGGNSLAKNSQGVR